MRNPENRSLRWFSLFTAFATLCLICIGGLVTSHGAGMAVPDWPNTYGYNMFAFPISQWVGGILYEHSHRLIASFVGLLTTILALWLWIKETKGSARWGGAAILFFCMAILGVRKMPVYWTMAALAPVVIIFGFMQARRNPGTLRWVGVVAFAAVILQGVLGGLRVTEMKDEIGIFHATLAQLFFVLICSIALFHTGFWKKLPVQALNDRLNLRYLFVAGTLLILAQLVLGATMRHQHAGLAIPDFPKAYGKWWPDMSEQAIAGYNGARLEATAYEPITATQIMLQMFHRIVAVLILVTVSVSARLTIKELRWQNPLSKIAASWMFLILFQVFLGATTIWKNKAADIATAHVAIGALSLVTGALLSIVGFRALKPATVKSVASEPAFAQAVPSK